MSTLTVPGAEQGAQHLDPGVDDVAALGRQREVRGSWGPAAPVGDMAPTQPLTVGSAGLHMGAELLQAGLGGTSHHTGLSIGWVSGTSEPAWVSAGLVAAKPAPGSEICLPAEPGTGGGAGAFQQEDRLTALLSPQLCKYPHPWGSLACCLCCLPCPPSTVLVGRMKVALQTHQILQDIAKEAFQRLIQNWHSGSGNRKIGNNK